VQQPTGKLNVIFPRTFNICFFVTLWPTRNWSPVCSAQRTQNGKIRRISQINSKCQEEL